MGKTPTPNEFPGYDTKQLNGEALVIWKLWEIQSTLFIAIAPRSTPIAPDRVLSMGQIELYDI